MKIIYMGTPDFAVEALEALASSRHEVTAVFTQPDKPKGRGKAMQFTPVKEVALRENIPVYQPKKVRDPEVIQKIRELAAEDERVHYLSFSRNFGKEAALLAGLSYAKGDYVTTMDADLQDPPTLLPQMAAMLEAGDCDNVATRRVNRQGEPKIRSFFARMFYKVMRKLSHIEIADGARDYRLMNRAMVDSILSVSEYNRFSKGIFAWVGYDTKWLEFQNVERSAGETKWSFWKLVRYSFDGIINFSDVPLKISSDGGPGLTGVFFIGIIAEIVRALVFGDPVAGWPSLVCIVTCIGGIQLFCMGIMGQYIAKTYLEVKKRPHYIVSDTNREDMEKVK